MAGPWRCPRSRDRVEMNGLAARDPSGRRKSSGAVRRYSSLASSVLCSRSASPAAESGLSSLSCIRKGGALRRRRPVSERVTDLKGEIRMKASLALVTVMLLLGAGCTTTMQRKVEQSPAICGFLGVGCVRRAQAGREGGSSPALREPEGDVHPVQQGDDRRGGLLRERSGQGAAQGRAAAYGPLLQESQRGAGQAVSGGGRDRSRGDEDRGRAPRCRGSDAGGALGHDGGPPVAGAQRRLRPRSGKIPAFGGRPGHRQDLGLHDGAGPGGRRGSPGRGGAIQTAAQWQWGDAENAIKVWSSLLADGMYAYTSGEKKP